LIYWASPVRIRRPNEPVEEVNVKTGAKRKNTNARKAAHKHKIQKAKRRKARALKKKPNGRLTSS